MELHGFLVEGEQVQASCEVKEGTLYATTRRLCYRRHSGRPATFQDLLYQEVGSVVLGRQGTREFLGWGSTLAIVGVLGALIFFSLDVLAGWITALVFLSLGLTLLGCYVMSRRVYLAFAGQAMLKDREWAKRWRFIVKDSEQARALIQTVRSRLQ